MLSEKVEMKTSRNVKCQFVTAINRTSRLPTVAKCAHCSKPK